LYAEVWYVVCCMQRCGMWYVVCRGVVCGMLYAEVWYVALMML